jgi:imidazolonepropionase-like amidohydrolase
VTDMFLHNANLFTAVDGEVITDGAIWIRGSHIRWSGATVDAPPLPDSATRHDMGGRFVMPGMTESHVHLSYANAGPTELDKQPVQTAMLDAVDNVRMVLGSGFTSAISFGSAQGIDIPLRDAIKAGRNRLITERPYRKAQWQWNNHDDYFSAPTIPCASPAIFPSLSIDGTS